MKQSPVPMELRHVLRGDDGSVLEGAVTKVTSNYVQFGVNEMDPLVVIELNQDELRLYVYGKDEDEGPTDIIPLLQGKYRWIDPSPMHTNPNER
jgi:hypothetical protein